MYQRELARSGEALFKIRGQYLLAVVIGGTVIAYTQRDLGPFASVEADVVWFWLSLATACAGALIRVITSGFAALGTSGASKDAPVAAELNTTGPYSLVRNPLYVGRILNFTGIAMLSGSWVYGALVFLISVLVYERVAVFEEEFLRSKFGEAHARWAEQVPMLLPRLHGWVKPKYPFWIRRCIRREDKKLFYLVTSVFLYDWARRGFDLSLLQHPSTWYWGYAAFLAVYLFERFLVRFTKTFDGIS